MQPYGNSAHRVSGHDFLPSDGPLRVVSWNLLRRVGANISDVRRPCPSAKAGPAAVAGSHAGDGRSVRYCGRPSLPRTHGRPHLWIGGLESACPGPSQNPASAGIDFARPGAATHCANCQFPRDQFCKCAPVARSVSQSLAVAAYHPQASGAVGDYRRFQRRRADAIAQFPGYRTPRAHPLPQQYRSVATGPLPGAGASLQCGRSA